MNLLLLVLITITWDPPIDGVPVIYTLVVNDNDATTYQTTELEYALDLQNGIYYIKVAGVPYDGVVGEYSDVLEIAVGQNNIPAPSNLNILEIIP